MHTITLEEHYASPAFLEGPGKGMVKESQNPGSYIASLFEQLTDISDKRIAAMDAAGIDIQVLSLTSPGTEQLDAYEAKKIAIESNNFVAAAVKRNSKRFAGFAALPTADPVAAAAELERTVREYNFKGANINGHIKGRYLDDKYFWPILERAQSLEVPIYIHPTQPPQPVVDASFKGFSPPITYSLSNAGWGWHIETGLHILRMILGGVFDQFPKLQIIIGHMGEALPFMVQRFDNTMPPQATKLKRPISAYLRENINYTFSGFNFAPDFQLLLAQVGIDRIMFSADHPYASMTTARQFLDTLPVSGADKNKIAYGNAEKLMRF